MQVLLVNSLYQPNIIGGAEKSVQILAESLLARGHRPVVVTTGDKTFTDTVNGVIVHYLKIPNLYWVFRANGQPALLRPFWHAVDSSNPMVPSLIDRILSDVNPDIVHTHNLAGMSVSVWKAAARRGVPIAHTLRDHYLLCPRTEMYRNGHNCTEQCRTCRLYSRPKLRASRLVDGVVGVAKFILEEHVGRGYFANVRIRTHIYNPIHLPEELPQRTPDKRAVRFGYVGMLVPAKGIEFLLEKFSRMTAPNAVLRVYGKALTEEYARSLHKRFGSERISFEGRRPPTEIYSSIDVLIVPSLRNEAFGRVIPEANSYGLPVIASNRGAFPEIIDPGKNGFVFDPETDGDLERRIVSLADEPEKIVRMRSSCLEAAGRFTEEHNTEQYLSVYEELVR